MQLISRGASNIRGTFSADVLDYACRFSADDSGTFTGHAAIFGELNAHNEVMRRGTFTRTLSDHQARNLRPPMLWSHRTDDPIGVWTDIREDEAGLAVTGKLVTETARGREAHALLKAGALTDLSIGFRGAKFTRNADGARSITDLDLVEISLVALPSAGNARINSVRAVPALADFTRALANASAAFRRKD